MLFSYITHSDMNNTELVSYKLSCVPICEGKKKGEKHPLTADIIIASY